MRGEEREQEPLRKRETDDDRWKASSNYSNENVQEVFLNLQTQISLFNTILQSNPLLQNQSGQAFGQLAHLSFLINLSSAEIISDIDDRHKNGCKRLERSVQSS